MGFRILILVALTSLALHAGDAASAAPVIRVAMTEFAFRPSVIRLSVGVETTIELANQGQLAHQFDAPVLRHAPVTVTDDSVHVEATGVEFVRIQPGGRARLRIMVRTRGRFPFACTIEGHAEAGMVGVLDVR